MINKNMMNNMLVKMLKKNIQMLARFFNKLLRRFIKKIIKINKFLLKKFSGSKEKVYDLICNKLVFYFIEALICFISALRRNKLFLFFKKAFRWCKKKYRLIYNKLVLYYLKAYI